jgi:hypothetical protein
MDQRRAKALGLAQQCMRTLLCEVLKLVQQLGTDPASSRPRRPVYTDDGGAGASTVSLERWLEAALASLGALGLSQEAPPVDADADPTDGPPGAISPRLQGPDGRSSAPLADADEDTVFAAELVSDAALLRDRVLALSTERSAQWLEVEQVLIERERQASVEAIEQDRLAQCPETKRFLMRPRRQQMGPEQHKAWLQAMLFALDDVDQVLRSSALAIKRVHLFAQPLKRPEIVETLLSPMLQFIYGDYVLPLLTEAVGLCTRESGYSEPDHFILTVIHGISSVDAKVLRFFGKYVYPQVALAPSARQSIEHTLRAARGQVDQQCFAALQSFLSACTLFVGRELAARSSNVYKPKVRPLVDIRFLCAIC